MGRTPGAAQKCSIPVKCNNVAEKSYDRNDHFQVSGIQRGPLPGRFPVRGLSRKGAFAVRRRESPFTGKAPYGEGPSTRRRQGHREGPSEERPLGRVRRITGGQATVPREYTHVCESFVNMRCAALLVVATREDMLVNTACRPFGPSREFMGLYCRGRPWVRAQSLFCRLPRNRKKP